MEIIIPDHMKEKRSNDYVSYTAIDEKGIKCEKDNICYAPHMDKLTTNSFDLVPYRKCKDWKRWAIDGDSYLRFIELFKDNWLIQRNVVAEVDGDGVLKMHIPIGTSRHRVYSAMCAYRWAESLPSFVFLILKLSDERKNLSFWQILHYAMSTQVSLIGHNWCNIGFTNLEYGNIHTNYGMSYNLGLSLSFPLFWHKTELELMEHIGTTCSNIDKITSKIAPCESKSKFDMGLPKLLVCGSYNDIPYPNDVLNPLWTPLYQYVSSQASCQYKEETIKKELLGMYEEITKKHDAVNTLREKLLNPKRDKFDRIIWN